MSFFEISGILFWAIITLYALIVVRLWRIRSKHKSDEIDEFIKNTVEGELFLKRNKIEEKNT